MAGGIDAQRNGDRTLGRTLVRSAASAGRGSAPARVHRGQGRLAGRTGPSCP